jgi:hypothetical protein
VSAYRRIGVGGKRIGVSANVRFAGLRTPLRCLVNTPIRRSADTFPPNADTPLRRPADTFLPHPAR